MTNNHQYSNKLTEYRTLHKDLSIHLPQIFVTDGSSILSLRYEIKGLDEFVTTYRFPFVLDLTEVITSRLVKYLSVVEALSYWKLVCPSRICLMSDELDEAEISFFKDVLLHGMSEFFFRNKLPLDMDIRFSSSSTSHKVPLYRRDVSMRDGFLIPIGGGKDSAVTLELIKEYAREREVPCMLFALNPIRASQDTMRISEIAENVIVSRSLDSKLMRYNEQGYFNGHTPFSSMLSFVTVLVAYHSGISSVVLSNESSANQGNIVVDGFSVNHQYSKTLAYEGAVRSLFSHAQVPVSYFSFLRPLSELQIAKLFSRYPQYHSIFQSCNVMQTAQSRKIQDECVSISPKDRWCGKCSKCVFVYIILRPFLSREELRHIFGDDISLYSSFEEVLCSLSGQRDVKPFECVGTFEEVALARDVMREKQDAHVRLQQYLSHIDNAHFLPEDLFSFLKDTVAV